MEKTTRKTYKALPIRDKLLNIRIHADEMERLKELAYQSRKTVSVYVRDLILKQKLSDQ